MLPSFFSKGPDYILSQSCFSLLARQHLVSELRACTERVFPLSLCFSTWLRIIQSLVVFTIPRVITPGHRDDFHLFDLVGKSSEGTSRNLMVLLVLDKMAREADVEADVKITLFRNPTSASALY